MSWATLPGLGETETLEKDLESYPGGSDFHLLYAAIRALILWSARQAPATGRSAAAILQFWDQAVPPADVLASLDSWHQAGRRLVRFSDAEARQWLAEAYGQEVLAPYLHCHHPAMRSDLFRLAWLLRQGGLYVDADDAYVGAGPMPGFERGLVLLPLAQQGAGIVPVAAGLQASTAGEYVGFFVNNAPLYAEAGHPVIEAALGSALAHLRACVARGERGNIHEHTGPSNLNQALLGYLVECHRNGTEPDVAVRLDWPWLRAFQPMDYKQGERNWRSGAALY